MDNGRKRCAGKAEIDRGQRLSSPVFMSVPLGPQVELSVPGVACTSVVGQSEGGRRRTVYGVVYNSNHERCWGRH